MYVVGPRNPRTVAEMNDANKLRGLASALEQNLDDLSAQDARKATIMSIQILNGAAKKLLP